MKLKINKKFNERNLKKIEIRNNFTNLVLYIKKQTRYFYFL
jgi:hypothetical protein